jgi:hypothetical protein
MEGSLAKRRPQGMEGEGDPGRAGHRGVTTAWGWRTQAMDGVGTCLVETGERGGLVRALAGRLSWAQPE